MDLRSLIFRFITHWVYYMDLYIVRERVGSLLYTTEMHLINPVYSFVIFHGDYFKLYMFCTSGEKTSENICWCVNCILCICVKWDDAADSILNLLSTWAGAVEGASRPASCVMSYHALPRLVDMTASSFLQVVVMVIREWLLLKVTAAGLSGSPCVSLPFCTASPQQGHNLLAGISSQSEEN